MSATPGEKLRDTLKTVRLINNLGLKRNEYYLGYGVDIYPGTEECNKFLQMHPDYEWITRNPQLKGKYIAVKDPAGNVIQPKYREYGLIGIACIYLLLSPAYFVEKIGSLGRKLLNRIFRQ